jgi:site-specific DNA recombinase
MPDAAIYCRVSTKVQAEQGSSLGSQRDACLKLAQERGYTVPDGYCLSEDASGANLDRPLLTRARELVKAGLVRAVICYSTDRLARNPVHIAIVAEECQKAGVELLFVTEPLDSSPEGRLIAYVKGYAAELEREKIRDRVMRGKRARALVGKLPQGYGKGLYGYTYNRETGWREVYEPQASWVRRMFEWVVEEGLTVNAARSRLQKMGVPTPRGGREWDHSTMGRMLHNPAYKGVTQVFRMMKGRQYRDPEEWVSLPNATPAIVPEALWNTAQAQLRRNLELSRRAAKRDYLLSGYLFCGRCGRRMCGRFMRNTRFYTCLGNRYVQERCGASAIRAEGMESEVWEAVGEIVRRPELIMAEVERLSDHEAVLLAERRLAEIERKVQAVRNDEKRLVRLFGYNEIDETFIVEETRRFQGERRGLEEERARLLVRRQEHLDAGAVQASIGQLVERVALNLESAGYEEKRLGLAALQVRVTVEAELEIRLSVPITLASPLSCHSNCLTFRCDHGAPVLVGLR